MKEDGGMREGGVRSERERGGGEMAAVVGQSPLANMRLKPNTRNLGAKGGRGMSLEDTKWKKIIVKI